MKLDEMQCIILFMKLSNYSNERGSVLFILLIGVALFAALGYAVSNMMQGGATTNIGEEQSKLYANELLDYGRTMRQTVQNLRISNGCSDTDISFENTIEGGYTNGTNTACQVFHPDGGGMTYYKPDSKWLDTEHSGESRYGILFFMGNTCANGVGLDFNNSTICRDKTSNYAELIMVIPYIKENICHVIADTVNALTPSNEIPIDHARAWPDSNPKFTGSYSSDYVLANINGDDSSNTLDGKMQGCFEGGGTHPASDTFHFYQVLIAR